MRAIKLVVLLLICAVPATADTVWDVTGAATIVGNDACGGPPCVETVAFSFEVTYGPLEAGYAEHVLPGAMMNSFGPLVPFDTLYATDDYFAFFNSAGDEIDLDGPLNDREGPPAPVPNLVDAELYTCGSSTCLTDFGFPIFTKLPAYPIFRVGTLQYTATVVPEGSTFSYLLIGIGLLPFGVFGRWCPELRRQRLKFAAKKTWG